MQAFFMDEFGSNDSPIWLWHIFSLCIRSMVLSKVHRMRLKRVRMKGFNSVIAHAASFMLTGVPPVVCESVIVELYCSVRKSIGSLMD